MNARSLILGLLLGASSSASAQVVVNEVLYDPVGPDDGAELIELHNPGRLGWDTHGSTRTHASPRKSPTQMYSERFHSEGTPRRTWLERIRATT